MIYNNNTYPTHIHHITRLNGINHNNKPEITSNRHIYTPQTLLLLPILYNCICIPKTLTLTSRPKLFSV